LGNRICSQLSPGPDFGLFEKNIVLICCRKDLAEHIMPPAKGCHGSPSGPTKALEYVAEHAGEKRPKDALALTEVLRKVLAAFNSPGKHIPTIQQLVHDCEEIQGRALNIADIEHALCKISRQIGKIKKARGHASKKQKV
jgi:hypothetical protein